LSLRLSDNASKNGEVSAIPTDQPPDQTAIPSEGSLFAYATTTPEGSAIRLRDLKTGAERQILGPLPGQCLEVAFDPIGRFVFIF
jgi:hypothetical protein